MCIRTNHAKAPRPNQFANLAQQGVKEINLLGQNVNAYRGEMEDGEILDEEENEKLQLVDA